MTDYPVEALADVLFGLQTALTTMRENGKDIIPGNDLVELCVYVARHHPEPEVVPWLVSELERMENHNE